MKIKNKILVSFGFLFLMLLTLGIVGSYYVNQLGKDAAEILKENNRTLIYMQHIDNNLDMLLQDILTESDSLNQNYINNIEENLELQKANITEVGEKPFTGQLEDSFSKLLVALNRDAKNIPEYIFEVKKITGQIYEINQEKILARNEEVTRTAEEVYLYITSISFSAIVIGFFFTIGMPRYLVKPIRKFNEAIQEISYGHYETRVDILQQDEFGQLASSFNMMSAKLEEFENSSYSKILFEKKRLDSIINQLNEAILGLDENKKVIFANQRMLSLLGLTEKQVSGKYAPDISVNNSLMHTLLGPVMMGGGKYEHDDTPLKITEGKSEKLFSKEYRDVIISPTAQERKILIGHVILLHDVTNFAVKDKAKTHFIATLSHELKTPVAAIEMGTDLLNDQRTGALNHEQKDWLHTIDNNNQRIKRIINEILELAQIESGVINIKKEKPSIEGLLQTSVNGVSPFLKKKELSITIDNDLGEAKLIADEQKLTWILNNFLTNAIRYAPKKSTIHLNARKTGEMVRISVKDSGKGLTSRQKEHLFTPFYQHKNNTSESTGLGLVISKEFVEAMGGSIGVISAEGSGAEFWVKLNLAS